MRTAKTPQYDVFNARAFCFGRHQLHDNTIDEWLDGSYLMLEVGAGTAKVSLAHARYNPDHQVLALDHKADRLGKAARVVAAEDMQNLAFVQSDLLRLDDMVDLSGRADSVWVTFPDPYPKDRDEKHRLTNTKMLDIYVQFLKLGGLLQFKTDNVALYEYSLQQIQQHPSLEVQVTSTDLHGSGITNAVALTQTTYEQKFLPLGLTTHYISAKKV